MPKTFTFADRETYMLEHTDELNEFYRQHWDVENIEIVTDKERQKAGIDKILHLKDGSKLNIDEKIESIKATQNIVFEDRTNIASNTAGWLKDGQLTDLVVFYQVNMRKIYVIPFQLMLQQYKEYRDIWLERNLDRVITNKTTNGYYRGRIFIVPKPEVFEYLTKYSDIELEDFEFTLD